MSILDKRISELFDKGMTVEQIYALSKDGGMVKSIFYIPNGIKKVYQRTLKEDMSMSKDISLHMLRVIKTRGIK